MYLFNGDGSEYEYDRYVLSIYYELRIVLNILFGLFYLNFRIVLRKS